MQLKYFKKGQIETSTLITITLIVMGLIILAIILNKLRF